MTAPLAPPLDPAKARYLTEGLDAVQGWLQPATALYLAGLETLTRGTADGGICEIGVHDGKSFLAMVLDLPPGQPAVAIDLFDLQHLNEDGTSTRAKAKFEAHLDTWGMRERVEVIEGSSLDLAGQGFLDAGRRFRLFSVDGGHNAPYVVNDLQLAQATLTPGGVVALDDVFNQHWLGVVTGLFQYLADGGTLRPFALVPNKLLLTDAPSVTGHRALMREAFGAALTKADIPLAGSDIDRYDDIAWTITDTDGGQAPLQRRANLPDAVRAELAGLRVEYARVKADLDRSRKQVGTLQRKLAVAQQRPTAQLARVVRGVVRRGGALLAERRAAPPGR